MIDGYFFIYGLIGQSNKEPKNEIMTTVQIKIAKPSVAAI